MILGYILVVALVAFDQIIKLISLLLRPDSPTDGFIGTLIPKVLDFYYIENTGASLGMFSDAQGFFAIVTVVSLVIFGYFFYQIDLKEKKVFSLAIILLIAGTFGNAIDRLFRDGAVIDMLFMPPLNSLLDIFNVSDFIFNIADAYMTFGIILFIIDILFLESKRDKKNEKRIEEVTTE